MSKLTDKQQRFVKEYLIDLNASAAALRAGYSKKTAFRAGQVNMQNGAIQAAVRAAIDKRSKRTEIKQDDVVKELARIAFGNLANVCDWSDEGVFLKDSKELPEHLTTTVNEVTAKKVTITKDGYENETVNTRIKLKDPMKALDMLARHLGMFAADESEKAKTTARAALEAIPREELVSLVKKTA